MGKNNTREKRAPGKMCFTSPSEKRKSKTCNERKRQAKIDKRGWNFPPPPDWEEEVRKNQANSRNQMKRG